MTPGEFPQAEQHHVLYDLQQEDCCPQRGQHDFALVFRQLAVKNAGSHAQKQTGRQPEEMGQTEGLKAQAFRYFFLGCKKHSYHPKGIVAYFAKFCNG